MTALRRLALLTLLLLPVIAYVASVRRNALDADARSGAGGSDGSFAAWDAPVDPSARLLVIGGGGEPDSTEVQLESDVRLAVETYAAPVVSLFACGAGRACVRETAAPAPSDPLFETLSTLFLGREHGAAHRPPRLHVDAPATYDNVLRALDALLVAPGNPLTVLLATHGQRADDPLDGYALLWGNEGLFVRDVVDLLSQPSTQRPVRMVVASCYGGAFGAIAGIEPRGEESVAMHCGVFATDEDRLASGCDPDPDRARHEGYLVHFLSALRARSRDGRALGGLDLDGDGHVSMLEAHTRARIASRSFDVPLTTSERFVREAAAELELAWDGAPPAALPEEEAVVQALGPALDVRSEGLARVAAQTAAQSLGEREDELADAEAMRDVAWNRLRVALLERWPWLEDAYLQDWEARVRRERAAIEAVVLRSRLAENLRETESDATALAADVDELRVREAMLERVVRAYDLPRMTAALAVRDPARHRRFLALRACERFVPPTRSERP